MTNENEETLDTTTNIPKRPRFDVAYCKPPRDSWFLAGTSGNPKGRPKGSKNKLKDSKLTDILREELFQLVEVEENGEKEILSTLRAVTQNLIASALDGNFRAQQWVISASRAVEAADTVEQEADYKYAEAYKEKWGGLFFRDESLEPIPNPNHIFLDKRHRRVFFSGPRNAEEKAEFEDIVAEKAQQSGEAGPEAEVPAQEELVDAEKANNQGTGPTEAEASDRDEEIRADPLPYRRDAAWEGDDGRLRPET